MAPLNHLKHLDSHVYDSSANSNNLNGRQFSHNSGHRINEENGNDFSRSSVSGLLKESGIHAKLSHRQSANQSEEPREKKQKKTRRAIPNELYYVTNIT